MTTRASWRIGQMTGQSVVGEIAMFQQSPLADKIELSRMKLLWCWRCKAEMPMLDDDEYRHVMSFRPATEGNLKTRFKSMIAEYERITGFHEANPNAVFHHRLSDYGPPCRHCGKPLRTRQAKLCGSCMKPVA
jgi:hypothetical protein